MERKKLWIKVANIASNIQSPWFIAGDFNSILSFEDRISANYVQANELHELQNCLTDYQVQRVKLVGSISLGIIKPLDKPLTNEESLTAFLEVFYNVLLKDISYQCLLILY